MTGDLRQVTGIIGESGAGAREFAGAAAQMHLMAEELKRMESRFEIDGEVGNRGGLPGG